MEDDKKKTSEKKEQAQGYRTIEVNKKPYYLAKETFEVLSLASAKYFGHGEVKLADAGRVIFDALYLGNQGSLSEIQEDTQLYFNLCYKAGFIVEFFEGDVKKN